MPPCFTGSIKALNRCRVSGPLRYDKHHRPVLMHGVIAASSISPMHSPVFPGPVIPPHTRRMRHQILRVIQDERILITPLRREIERAPQVELAQFLEVLHEASLSGRGFEARRWEPPIISAGMVITAGTQFVDAPEPPCPPVRIVWC